VSRRQDNAKAADNIRWLHEHSHAHLHVDLIAGLPGEDVASFARGFDQLVSLGAARDPVRHPEAPARHADHPPYRAVSRWCSIPTRPTPCWRPSRIDFADHAAPGALCPLLGPGGQLRPLRAHRQYTAGVCAVRELHGLLRLDVYPTDATHRIALDRLAKLVQEWLQLRGMSEEAAKALLASDYAGNVDKPAVKQKAAAPRTPGPPPGRVKSGRHAARYRQRVWQSPRISFTLP
jgi:hypothetical protein